MPRRSPAVTVLLAVFNDDRYLPMAIQSILQQSFDDFELLAIDDGSTDSSGEYLDALRDPRVRVIHNRRNIGLTASLNLGLDASRGGYIARMDADDVCEPDRLQRQVEFLDAHPSVGVLGTSRRLIDEAGAEVAIARAVEGDAAIRWKCLLGNPFAHPTVMLRRSVLAEHVLLYDESFRTAQDYELWTRLLAHTQGENLAEPLLRYRLRDGISRLSKAEQLANHDRIAHAACCRLLPEFPLSLEEVRQLRGRFGGFSVRDPNMDPADVEWADRYRRMREAFTHMYGELSGIASVTMGQTARFSG
jgi:glycosyltransferase involved in cell wall biosynthesis